jgi:hypothetical protein
LWRKNKFDINVSFDLTLDWALVRLVAQNKKSATNVSLRIEVCPRFRSHLAAAVCGVHLRALREFQKEIHEPATVRTHGSWHALCIK